MFVLFIDTSASTAQVAIMQDGEEIVRREWQTDRELGRKLIEAIDHVLQEAGVTSSDIDRIAVHQGKKGGSFMAQRTGNVVAMILAEAWYCQLVPIASATGEKVE